MSELLEQHPLAAQLISPMPPADLRDLANNIKTKGYDPDHPVILFEGKVLIGWSRYIASLAENVEPFISEYSGDDPVGYIESEDLIRRHLAEPDRKKAKAAAKKLLATHPEYSNRRIARESGYNRTDVGELRSAVMSGTDISNDAPEAQGSSPKQAPRIVGMLGDLPIMEGEPATPPPPKPVQTFEEGTTKTGQPRKARGRPAGSGKKAEAAKKEVKPKPLTDPRGELILKIDAHFKRDPNLALHDVTAIIKDLTGMICERIPEYARRACATALLAALGFAMPEEL
jgi:hypothetical protein